MIYKVAVADDEPEAVARLSAFFGKYKDDENRGGGSVSFNVDTFGSGDELLTGQPDKYDIIVLDINMPGTNGLQTARRVRASNQSAAILFCTNYAQYALKGYEVNAAGYLIKPIEEQAFRRNLNRTLKLMQRNQSQKMQIKTAEGSESISVADIVYIEVQIHNIFFNVLCDGKIVSRRTRGSMRGICETLNGADFSQCGASYLVNLRHVLAVKGKEVVLRGGTVLPISRKFDKSFSEAFMKFFGKGGE